MDDEIADGLVSIDSRASGLKCYGLAPWSLTLAAIGEQRGVRMARACPVASIAMLDTQTIASLSFVVAEPEWMRLDTDGRYEAPTRNSS